MLELYLLSLSFFQVMHFGDVVTNCTLYTFNIVTDYLLNNVRQLEYKFYN